MVARRIWINPPFDMGDPRRRFHPEAEPGRYRPTPKLRSALDRLFPGGWGDACPKITSADEWSAKVTLDRASATCEPRRLHCVAKFGNCRTGRLHVEGYAP